MKRGETEGTVCVKNGANVIDVGFLKQAVLCNRSSKQTYKLKAASQKSPDVM